MRVLASLSLIGALALFPVASRATTFTDGFNAATNVQLSVTTAGNFSTIGGTNVDLLGTADGFAGLCTPGDGSIHCVDLGGTGGNSQGDLQSNTVFGPGTYDLSFFLTGSGRGNTTSTEVTLGDYDHTFTLASGDQANVVNVIVTVTAADALTFHLLEDTQEGSVLNTASVSSLVINPTSVPEPSSLLLLGSGMLSGLGFITRRRNR